MVTPTRRDILAGAAAFFAAGSPARATTADLKHLGLVRPPLAIEAPELNIPDIDGVTHNVEQYRGKVVLVSFWATWCPPCRKEMPALARLNRELGNDRFAVLAVNLGDKEARIKSFLEEIDHDGLPILLDRSSSLAQKWYIRGLPVAYILDGQGQVIYGAIGERVWDAPQMVSGLRSLS